MKRIRVLFTLVILTTCCLHSRRGDRSGRPRKIQSAIGFDTVEVNHGRPGLRGRNPEATDPAGNGLANGRK